MGICMSHKEMVRTLATEVVTQPREYKAYVPPPLETKHKMYDYNEVRHNAETIAFILCPHANGTKSDRVMAVDVDPESSTYSTVVSYVEFPTVDDEPCRMNWTRSATNLDNIKQVDRSHLVVPCFRSSRIYIVAVEDNELALIKCIISDDLLRRDLSSPFAVHTLPLKGAPIHVSTLGDRDGHGKGDFILIDRRTFEIRDRTNKNEFTSFGGDFCMQTRHNLLISCESGHPRILKKGFLLRETGVQDCRSSRPISPSSTLSLTTPTNETRRRTPSPITTLFRPRSTSADAKKSAYGCHLNIWQISPGILKQRVELDVFDGCFTTTVRFLHNPECNHAFVCSAIGSSVFHLHMDTLTGEFKTDKIIQIRPIRVENWCCSEIPAMFTDLVISMDDKYLYVAAWLHGLILQYDITDPFRVSICSKIAIGGILSTNPTVKTQLCPSQALSRSPTIIKGIPYRGGPASLQLSLDGKRLYVCNSFFRPWDEQFYPQLLKQGGQIIKIDVDLKTGVLSLNKDFLIDLGQEEGGPFVSRDIHFSTGDCTSDNFL